MCLINILSLTYHLIVSSMSSKSPTQKGSEVLYPAHRLNNKKRSISIHLMLRSSGMDLSQLYSNTFLKIIKYKHSLTVEPATPVKTNISERKSKNKYGETEVHQICQNQKILSDDEIKQIIQGYERGLSTYKLAKQFNCHRYTIANALKKNGIEVTNQCAKKKVLAEMIIQMYSEWYKPQEIGEALGISADTVRRILHDNNVYIHEFDVLSFS